MEWATRSKFGNLSPVLQQLCYAHAIDLSVTDVLYQRKEKKSSESEDSEEEEGEGEDNEEEEEGASATEALELRGDIAEIIKKVRCRALNSDQLIGDHLISNCSPWSPDLIASTWSAIMSDCP